MKKLLKLLTLVLCFTFMLSFVACGGNDKLPEEEGGVKTYVMEAEYIDLDDVIGTGLSGGPSGVGMIFGDGTTAEKNRGWSSGYYVGYTYTTDCRLDFVFTSSKAATATIILRVGSELGDLPFDPTTFGILLNDTEITYQSMYIAGSADMLTMAFADKTITTNAALVEGENTISLVVKDNTLYGAVPAAPVIDCIKIKTEANLTYTEKKDNPAKRGGI